MQPVATVTEARQVYAVEASGFAAVAARNVHANGVAHIVRVLQSRVEDVSIPEKVKPALRCNTVLQRAVCCHVAPRRTEDSWQ